MSGILVYALHHEGAFNKNSLGAVSEGARLAGELGSQCDVVVVGDKAGLPDDLCASLGRYGAAKVHRVEGPEGLAQPVVDAMAKIIGENGHGYALFGGGLLGFEIGAGLTARLDAGVCMEVTSVRVEDGKLVSERPILQDSSVSKPSALPSPRPPATRMSASSMLTSAPRCSPRMTIFARVECGSNSTWRSSTAALASPVSLASNAFRRPMITAGPPSL